MTSNELNVKPIKIKEYVVKQSKYENCGKLPIRSVLLGPSGSGKTVLLTNLIMDVYKGCFERIYIFSPSINVDTTWIAVKEHIEKELELHETDDDKFYFDNYDEDALEKITTTQKKMIEHMKGKNKTKLYSVLIVIDDLADDPRATRHSKLLHSLYTRGRHSMISTITATQKFNCISPIIRVNATELFVYRLRNKKDLDTFIEEVSAVLDKKTLMNIYNSCTREPFSFLYVKLTAKSIDDMFYCNFNKRISFSNTN
jgi:hypothetical protein